MSVITAFAAASLAAFRVAMLVLVLMTAVAVAVTMALAFNSQLLKLSNHC